MAKRTKQEIEQDIEKTRSQLFQAERDNEAANRPRRRRKSPSAQMTRLMVEGFKRKLAELEVELLDLEGGNGNEA